MSDERALLAAICAHPEEDTPRLAYADWLQEHGQPDRGEFIRVECELARPPETARAWRRLNTRAKLLWDQHEAEWAGPVAESVEHYHTRRGFIEEVELSLLQFTRHAETIFSHSPLVNNVFITARGPWTACFARPEWSRVRTFGASEDVMTPFGLGKFLACPHLTGLRDLNLGFGNFGAAGGARVGQWPHLRKLTRLDLLYCAIGDVGAAALLDGLNGSGIEHLCLARCGLTDVSALRMRNTEFPALAELQMYDNALTAVGAGAIASAPWAAGLCVLNLHTNPIGDAGGEALLASPHLANLRELRLSACGICPAIAARLRNRFGDKVVKV